MATPFATRSITPPSDAVTAIGRRKLGISHPKLKEVLHRDFADCSALAAALSGQDAAVFAWAHIPARCRTPNSAR